MSVNVRVRHALAKQSQNVQDAADHRKDRARLPQPPRRHRLRTAFTILAAITLLAILAPQHRAEAHTGDIYYQLINRQDGQCAAVRGGSGNHAEPVVATRCYGGLEEQWRLVPVGGGFHQLRVRHSNMCLDVAYRRGDNGAGIVQATCADPTQATSWNQHWQVVYIGGYYQLKPRHVYDNKCLHKSGNSVIQYDCMQPDSWWDQWSFADVTPLPH